MKYETIIVGPFETNCYLVYSKNLACAVIDPGADPQKIIAEIERKRLRPVVLINTHGHVDHVGANKDIKEKYEVPFYIHADDDLMLQYAHKSELATILRASASPPPDDFLKDGQVLNIGPIQLEVIHTPGHSPGSVSLKRDKVLFSGDTLFCGGVGRTDLPGGSWDALERSVKEKIFRLADETLVLPGHGPLTTVAQEKKTNPYIR